MEGDIGQGYMRVPDMNAAACICEISPIGAIQGYFRQNNSISGLKKRKVPLRMQKDAFCKLLRIW